MYCLIVNTLGGFHNGLADRGVSMHDATEFVGGRLQSHADAGLGKQFGGVRADDMDTEHLVIFLFGDDLDKAIGLAEDVFADLDDEVRSNPDDIAVECGVMQLAQGDAVRNDWITSRLPVRDDVGRVEQFFVRSWHSEHVRRYAARTRSRKPA